MSTGGESREQDNASRIAQWQDAFAWFAARRVAGGELGSKLPQAAAGQLEAALETLGELVILLEKHVGAMVSRPSKVEIEFGATVSGEGNLWVVSGKGEAEFKVSLAWDGAKGA